MVERTKRRQQTATHTIYLRSLLRQEEIILEIFFSDCAVHDARRRKSKRMVQWRPTASIVVSIVEHITVIMELMVKRERCHCVRAIIIENNPVVLWSTVHPVPFCMSNDKNPFAEAIRFVWEHSRVCIFGCHRRTILCGKKSDRCGRVLGVGDVSVSFIIRC